ncbi:ion transporter [Frigoriflavimonas asaccharolytica]|uniref:Voltage-gated potassium channel n=1 Tax=Frigoriflavimonas asaccharolytica TaxID=2735899 RepID=A0A8J8G9H1_9FLAO|nr:ion transporter [Frigoriflavimonas asaccharolytica]NRS91432.1 voltage-gated potassium channel [Frigoriflavimonas asaccharolytica]
MALQKEHNLVPEKGWKRRVFLIIYYSNTKAGKLFDVLLILMILTSTIVIMLESMSAVDIKFHEFFVWTEWTITAFFTVEYILRILVVKNKKQYIFSFMGIIDLLSILPLYLSLFFHFTKFLSIIRLLRILRVFRILNLLDYMNDGQYIMKALKSSSRKIYIFLLFICILVTIIGSMMFVIEEGNNGFTNIPTSIYWAVVTVTTVGYGDIAPMTALGKFLSVILMLCGYSIIAVPTGIMTAEMQKKVSGERECKRCGTGDISNDARYCRKCGERLPNVI